MLHRVKESLLPESLPGHTWTGNGEIEKIYHNYILTGKDKGANYGTISGCD